jgi:parallel beta-helix repeat protein
MRKEWLVKILALVIVFLFISSGVVSAFNNDNKSKPINNGKWLYVGGSGPGNYTQIQDAIDNASTGDIVYVYDDSAPYLERLAINTTLTLLGENQTTTIINSTAEDYYTIITINADDVFLSGFLIVLNGGPGVEVFANHTKLSNLMMYSGLNNGWSGTGVTLHTTHYTEITDTIITNAQIGILLTNSTHATITHNKIIDPGLNGITLYSSDSTIDDNTIIGNIDQYARPVGIHISGSRNHISNNTITAMLGNAINGISLSGVTDSIIEGNDLQNTGFEQDNSAANHFVNNTVNGKPLVFLVNQSDTVIDNAGQVILVNCTRITVQDLTLSCSPYGVQLAHTTNSIIQRCNISSCRYGAYLEESQDILIQNNTLLNCEWGFNIYKGGSNRIENNTISRSDYSGLLISSKATQLSYNFISNCSVGITITDCLHNIVTRNVIQHCVYGVYLESTAAAAITQNTFLDNRLFAGLQQNTLLNRWTGNYWGRPRVVPKIIPGIILIIWHPDPIHYKNIIIPWINIDWHPALKPYDIPLIG